MGGLATHMIVIRYTCTILSENSRCETTRTDLDANGRIILKMIIK